MNVYQLLRLNSRIKSHRLKFLGLWLLSVSGKRHLSIQLDPVLACNLRCTMCYFTDAEFVRKKMKGIMKKDDLARISEVIFKYALKLQIGCAAEPTLFKDNVRLVELAKEKKVPFISMVTNGNLLDKKQIFDLVSAGLDEFILSMHGVHKETYEKFMGLAQFEKFHETLSEITAVKQQFPQVKLRINYTFNSDNFGELRSFFERCGKYKIDVIQLRPVDKIGESAYQNFSLKSIEDQYPDLVANFQEEAIKRNITLLFPASVKRNENQSLKVAGNNDSSYLMPYTYCYVGPDFFWKDDFDWRNEGFAKWQERNRWNWRLFKNIFVSKSTLASLNRNMLNYDVEIHQT
ncbi:radical SAM protein [Flavobacterium sp.]|uniref:radical SAM protein n=1 Tax=Flavobacterium sp. TaxID=239 RepID=UPI0026098109|nr:radical SAM protein [Flavobacterium sp.]